MQGLYHLQDDKGDRILDKLDEMSSVSGGGYAASWYYVQSLNNDFNETNLFDDQLQYQFYLKHHGELVSHFAATSNPIQVWLFRRLMGYLVGCGSQIVLSQPVNVLANGLFGQHDNVVPMRRIYQEGIDRVSDVVPQTDGRRSAYDLIGFRDCSFFQNLPRHYSLGQLYSPDIIGHLPLPIVNTTAHLMGENESTNITSWLQSRVFEFTPFHYGSDYFGYKTNNFPVDYNRAISISGAAADSKKMKNPSARLIASAFNCDLGYFIDNPSNDGTGRAWRKLLPFPFYLFDHHYFLNSAVIASTSRTAAILRTLPPSLSSAGLAGTLSSLTPGGTPNSNSKITTS